MPSTPELINASVLNGLLAVNRFTGTEIHFFSGDIYFLLYLYSWSKDIGKFAKVIEDTFLKAFPKFYAFSDQYVMPS